MLQVYPSVEYDFVPDDLNLNTGDMVHFQWTGSDYNPRRGCNNAEGGPPDPNTATAANDNSRADRSNIVEKDLFGDGYPSTAIFSIPVPARRSGMANPAPNSNRTAAILTTSMFADAATLLKMAFIKQVTLCSRTSL